MTATMQRVRIGLTGLAFVFLAVLLAAVFTSKPSVEEPITANLIEQQRAGVPAEPVAAAEPEAEAEPLAELGVAPGKAEDNQSAAARPQPPQAQPQP
jgi:hypothetical protein